MMKPMAMPMPKRPRLPLCGRAVLSLASSKANPTISKELADTNCDSKCPAPTHSHSHHHSRGNGTQTSSRSSPSTSMGTENSFPSSSPLLLAMSSSSLSSKPLLRTEDELIFFPEPPPPITMESMDRAWADTGSITNNNSNNNSNFHQQASLSNLDLFDVDFKFNEEMNHVNYNLNDDEEQPELLDMNESITSLVSSCNGNGRDRDYSLMESGGLFDFSSQQQSNNSNSNNNNPMVLHQACMLCPHNVQLVRSAIVACPQAVMTPSPIPLNEYTFPLHIALSKGANLAVIQQLAVAGPAVLLHKDGPMGLTPLSLALAKEDFTSLIVLQFLIQAEPLAATMACGPHYDLPLHTVCRQSATPLRLAIMEALIPSNTGALHQPNGQGLTPLDLWTNGGQTQSQQQSTPSQQQCRYRIFACLKYAANMTRPSASASPLLNAAAAPAMVAASGNNNDSYKRRKMSLTSYM